MSSITKSIERVETPFAFWYKVPTRDGIHFVSASVETTSVPARCTCTAAGTKKCQHIDAVRSVLAERHKYFRCQAAIDLASKSRQGTYLCHIGGKLHWIDPRHVVSNGNGITLEREVVETRYPDLLPFELPLIPSSAEVQR